MTFIIFLNFYLENNLECSSFLAADEMFYLFRQYGNQKELHRSHLVSTKTGGTQCGVGINNLAYSYLLVHFIEKKNKGQNCSKQFKDNPLWFHEQFLEKKISAWYCVKQYERKKETNKQKK